MIFQIDIDDEQSVHAAVQRFDEPRDDCVTSRMRQVHKARIAVCEVHHEAVPKLHAVAFWGDVRPALEVRERDAGNLREPSNLLEEGEPLRWRHLLAESAKHHVPHRPR
ncbi:hypothetical protein L5014_29550 [Paraburkholderia sp. RG36]|uniref:Uncharacterized protein n=1 Tax=Paraburkholderia tagetis TaxID=2913261 RepID=A0A9X1UL83_9BURK|nr:hypothetical protein [Paraburkholderia tagetis]MCG5077443.1 hypothetical protein [Paraburkholderia tagetis]